MSITIKRPRGTVELCVDLSLQTAWEAATEELRRLQQNQSGMLVNPELAAAARVVQDLEAQMREATLVFELEALPKKKWQEFEAAHPPRKGESDDENFGVNCSTFFDAVMLFDDTKSPTPHPVVVGVTEKATKKPYPFDAATEWMSLADEMTDGQYNDFALKILNLNRRVSGSPFSPAASKLTAASAKS